MEQQRRPWVRLSLFWIWSIIAIALLWAFTGPDYDGYDRFPTLMARIWLAGPLLCLSLSIILVAVRPSALWLVRGVGGAHIGFALVASVTANVLRWSAGTEEAFGTAIVFAIGLAAMVPLVLLVPRGLGANSPFLRARTTMLASVIVSTVALFAWSLMNIVVVEARAGELAGARPYCLQVVSGDRQYRAVSSHMDLTGLSMQAPFTSGGGSDTFQWVYHAILVVDGRLYNWSYMAGIHSRSHLRHVGFGSVQAGSRLPRAAVASG